MSGCWRLRFDLPASTQALDETCTQVRARLVEDGLAGEWFALALLLRESLNNAVLHGSASDSSRAIACEVRRGRVWWTLVVEDGGEGFAWLRRRAVDDDAEHGRGLQILG